MADEAVERPEVEMREPKPTIRVLAVDANVKALTLGEAHGDSAHTVHRGHYYSAEAALYYAGQSVSSHQTTFVKFSANARENEEEATLSALYQMDCGASAAKTVLVDAKEGGHQRSVGIASMALPNFIDYQSLRDKDFTIPAGHRSSAEKAIKIKDIASLPGLATVLMSSWVYGEDDLHARNFGVCWDASLHEGHGGYRWARLDFGMSFAEITHSGRPIRDDLKQKHFSLLTLQDFNQFPALEDATLFYWPGRRGWASGSFNPKSGNKYSEEDKDHFEKLKDSEIFKSEKNRFILRQFLIPVADKKQLILQNIHDRERARRISSNLENRLHALQWTALANTEFRGHLIKTFDDFDNASDFKNTELYKLVKETYLELDNTTLAPNPYHEIALKFARDEISKEAFQALAFFRNLKPIVQQAESIQKATSYEMRDKVVANEFEVIIKENKELIYSVFSDKEKNYQQKQQAAEGHYQEILKAAYLCHPSSKATRDQQLQRALNEIKLLKAQMSFFRPIDELRALIDGEVIVGEEVAAGPGIGATLDGEKKEKLILALTNVQKNWLEPHCKRIEPSERTDGDLNDDLRYQDKIANRLRHIHAALEDLLKQRATLTTFDDGEAVSVDGVLDSVIEALQLEGKTYDDGGVRQLEEALKIAEKELAYANYSLKTSKSARAIDDGVRDLEPTHAFKLLAKMMCQPTIGDVEGGMLFQSFKSQMKNHIEGGASGMLSSPEQSTDWARSYQNIFQWTDELFTPDFYARLGNKYFDKEVHVTINKLNQQFSDDSQKISLDDLDELKKQRADDPLHQALCEKLADMKKAVENPKISEALKTKAKDEAREILAAIVNRTHLPHFRDPIGRNRLDELFKRAGSDLQKAKTHSGEKLCIYETELIVAKLALDIERHLAREKIDLIKRFELNETKILPQGFNSKQYGALIEANRQLSQAMAHPDYHKVADLKEIAYAGYLGVQAMRNPCMHTASACLRQADKVKNTRVKSRLVVFGYVLTGLFCLLAAAAAISIALLGAKTVVLPILGTMAAWKLAAIATGSFVAAGLISTGSAKTRDIGEQNLAAHSMHQFFKAAKKEALAPTPTSLARQDSLAAGSPEDDAPDPDTSHSA